MHRVVIVALDRLVAIDLAIPCDLFRSVRLSDGSFGYSVCVCGVTEEVQTGPFHLRVGHGLEALALADTIVLPGLEDIAIAPPEPLVRALCAAAARGARIASICSGALLLAATGLLDGHRATTHWLAAPELARRHPRVEVDPHVLYVDAGQVLTSAGVAAGFDLCLHMIRRDYGCAVAAGAARTAIMPLERDGGQSQFIVHAPPASEDGSLSRVLHWLEQSLAEPLTLDDIARRAGRSVRSLTRHFKEQTGTTPLRWLVTARVRRAQQLLETTPHSVEQIAMACGFGSVTALRDHFRRLVLTSPQAYRRSFQSASARRAVSA